MRIKRGHSFSKQDQIALFVITKCKQEYFEVISSVQMTKAIFISYKSAVEYVAEAQQHVVS